MKVGNGRKKHYRREEYFSFPISPIETSVTERTIWNSVLDLSPA